jgi:hypothetical protein
MHASRVAQDAKGLSNAVRAFGPHCHWKACPPHTLHYKHTVARRQPLYRCNAHATLSPEPEPRDHSICCRSDPTASDPYNDQAARSQHGIRPSPRQLLKACQHTVYDPLCASLAGPRLPPKIGTTKRISTRPVFGAKLQHDSTQRNDDIRRSGAGRPESCPLDRRA